MPLTRVPTNGIELAVRDEGSGPAVLLFHGFPDDHTVWDAQVPALVKAGYRVIAPDTRGAGESDLPAAQEAYRIELLVADLVGLLDALGIAQAAVVGHDWGAVQAWHLAMWHPQRVSRLAALSVGHPAAYAGGGWRQKLKGWYVLVFCLRGFAEWAIPLGNWRMFRRMRQNPAEAEATIARYARPGRLTAGLNYYRANARRFMWQADRGRLPMPVLGLYSDGDRFLTAGQMQNSAAYVDGPFRYACIEGVAHWLQQEAPERVNAELLAFLAEG
jgi:pimeloyl-ACP methyl ester carboxylesterase